MSKRNKNSSASNDGNGKKGRRRKIFLKILAGLLAVIVLFVGITTVISVISLKANINKAKSFKPAECKQLELDNYSDGCWNIISDNGLKVLQLTDVHLGGGWMSPKKDSMSMNAVAAMITAEKPDFVIVTGDIGYPVPFQAGTFNNKSSAKLFAELMESLGVYWTLSYGNHDTEAYSYYDRNELTEFYSGDEYPHCLLQEGAPEADGSGNQIFNIKNSDGVVTRSLFILDSHSYVDGDILGILWKYDNIHENQIKWYSDAVASIIADNNALISSLPAEKAAEYADLADNVPSSVFMHIPISEYRDAWNEYVDNGYQNTENTIYNYGTAGESGKVVYSGVYEDELFETMLGIGSTDTVFCGHDHLNNFSLTYKGIDLTYSMSIDYLAYSGIYKLGSQRGCTVISIAEDGSIEYNAESYYQDKYISQFEKEEVTMQKLGSDS